MDNLFVELLFRTSELLRKSGQFGGVSGTARSRESLVLLLEFRERLETSVKNRRSIKLGKIGDEVLWRLE
jgi:hypothetical protein